MQNPFPKTLDGVIISTVMLFVFVWQTKSALLLAGITVNSMVHLWVMLSTLLLYVVFAFVTIGVQQAQEIEDPAASEAVQ